MPFKMVLWCNGSTRDFGSLRDCSIQSGTTLVVFLLLIIFHTCITACESGCTLLIFMRLIIEVFICLKNKFDISQLLVISR